MTCTTIEAIHRAAAAIKLSVRTGKLPFSITPVTANAIYFPNTGRAAPNPPAITGQPTCSFWQIFVVIQYNRDRNEHNPTDHYKKSRCESSQ